VKTTDLKVGNRYRTFLDQLEAAAESAVSELLLEAGAAHDDTLRMLGKVMFMNGAFYGHRQAGHSAIQIIDKFADELGRH